MVTKLQKAEQEEARDRLREILQPGDTVYTVLRHVSRSGMTRHIDAYKMGAYGEDQPAWLSYNAAKAIGARLAPNDHGVIMGGCGMDMGFALVYDLSRTLWPDGFDCVGPVRYLRDDELSATEYPHIKHWEACGEQGEVYATSMIGASGALPAYLDYDHACPSNDHANTRRGEACPFRHRDGGYALNQRWL